MHDNDEYLDEELDDEDLDELDDEDMEMLDDGMDMEEGNLFWKLEVKENEQNMMEAPENFDGVVCITQASFGETVNKDSRTVVCCTTPFLTEPTPICVLAQGTNETRALKLKFGSPAEFSLKGHRPSTVYLTGYVEQPLDNIGDLPDDEDLDIPQNILSKMKRRYDDEEAELLEPASKKRKIEAPKGKKAVEAKKPTPENKKPQQPAENKKQQAANKKQQQQANKKPQTQEPQTSQTQEAAKTPQTQEAAPTPQTSENKPNESNATTPIQPAPTQPAQNKDEDDSKLTKSQKKKLKKQKQSNGKATENATPKPDDKAQEEKPNQNEKTENINTNQQTSEKTETASQSNDTPTKDANEKNGTKDSEDSKNKSKQQNKLVEKKFPNGIEIKDLKLGNGAEVKNGQVVHLWYAGQLANKTVFDKQLTGTGFQYKFGSDEGIKGWHLGMKGMKIGGKRRIVVPPKFAFGVDGNPAKNVPGDSTLTYTIEILEEPKK